MGEKLVGLRHLVGVFPPLDRSPLALESVMEFICKALRHWLAFTAAGVSDNDPDGERLLTLPGAC